MNKGSLTLFFLLFTTHIFCQKVQFNIMKGDDNIGKIIASKTGSNYKVNSTATFRVIWKYTRNSDTKVSFNGSHLLSSDSRVTMNEELKKHLITTKNGTKYTCKDHKENTTTSLNSTITFCTSMLYFKEPVNRKTVFAEAYQKNCKISKISTGIYKLELPEGKVNHYVYKKGRLEEVKVFRSIVNLVFKRAH